MTAPLKIDTLKFAQNLTDAGLVRPVAEAIVEATSEVDTSDLATKADLPTGLAAVKSEPLVNIAETKAELVRFMPVQAVTLIKLLP